MPRCAAPATTPSTADCSCGWPPPSTAARSMSTSCSTARCRTPPGKRWYRQAWAYGRTLQVPDTAWPADVAAFDAWWEAQARRLAVDEEVRGYMQAVLGGGKAPWWVRPALPLQRLATAGLLPPRLRELYGLPWDAGRERRWQAFRRWAPRLYRLAPRWLRHLPARYYRNQLRRHYRD